MFKHLQINILKYLDKILISFFLFSLFFPFRYLIENDLSYVSGGFSDFTSFSFYLSDILFFLLLLRALFKSRLKQILYNIEGILYIFLLLISLTLFFSFYLWLNIFVVFKLVQLIVAYGTIKSLNFNFDHKKLCYIAFSIFSSIQSALATFQFIKQSSLGLYIAGEQHLSANLYGIAKIVSDGTKYIRGYGTFPHPNPLSAFIIIGIFCSLYLLINSKVAKQKYIYSILLYINIFGLLLTFSRGAFISLLIGFIYLFFSIFLKNLDQQFKKIAFKSILVIIFSISLGFVVLKPYLETRTTFSDNSTVERKFYNYTGLKMLFKNPFGVGGGESMLHMEQYSQRSLEPWEKQPPHNYFIVLGAEFGIVPLLIFIYFLFSKFIYQIKKTFNEKSGGEYIKQVYISTIFICILLLMQFDHYFYTLQQTQFMLWTFLAFVSSETKNPSYENKKGSVSG